MISDKLKKFREMQAQQTQPKNENATQYSNYYPFWLMKTDERCIIRILPDKDENNPNGFFVKRIFHEIFIDGKKRRVPCINERPKDKDCPICMYAQTFYDAGDKVNGKKWYRKQNSLVQAIIREDPLPPNEEGEKHTGMFRFIELSPQVVNAINKDMSFSPDLEDLPYSMDNGNDFMIVKGEAFDGKSKQAQYDVGSRFLRIRPLTESERELAEENMIVLSSKLPSITREEVQDLLAKAIHGGSEDGADDYEFSSNNSPKPSESFKTETVEEPSQKSSNMSDEEQLEMLMNKLKRR